MADRRDDPTATSRADARNFVGHGEDQDPCLKAATIYNLVYAPSDESIVDVPDSRHETTHSCTSPDGRRAAASG